MTRSPLPEPPYYAVIFWNRRSGTDEAGYAETAERMDALAAQQPGYLGIESVRGENGEGITVSYWQSEAAIKAWKGVADHAAARETGRKTWYTDYVLRVAKVERAYDWSKAD